MRFHQLNRNSKKQEKAKDTFYPAIARNRRRLEIHSIQSHYEAGDQKYILSSDSKKQGKARNTFYPVIAQNRRKPEIHSIKSHYETGDQKYILSSDSKKQEKARNTLYSVLCMEMEINSSDCTFYLILQTNSLLSLCAMPTGINGDISPQILIIDFRFMPSLQTAHGSVFFFRLSAHLIFSVVLML